SASRSSGGTVLLFRVVTPCEWAVPDTRTSAPESERHAHRDGEAGEGGQRQTILCERVATVGRTRPVAAFGLDGPAVVEPVCLPHQPGVPHGHGAGGPFGPEAIQPGARHVVVGAHLPEVCESGIGGVYADRTRSNAVETNE